MTNDSHKPATQASYDMYDIVEWSGGRLNDPVKVKAIEEARKKPDSDVCMFLKLFSMSGEELEKLERQEDPNAPTLRFWTTSLTDSRKILPAGDDKKNPSDQKMAGWTKALTAENETNNVPDKNGQGPS